MFAFMGRRFLIMIPTVILISIISFIIIELPPGDMASSFVANLEDMKMKVGSEEANEMIEGLRATYGLDRPLYQRYFIWIANFVRGDFGYSFAWMMPVRILIADRIVLTALITFSALLFSNFISWPIGIGAAVRQYSLFDNIFSFIAFIMMAIPTFLFALLAMYVSFKYFGISPGGLFSPRFIDAPWSFSRLLDLLSHLWVPILIVGLGSIGGGVRTIRANLLDQLRMPYVTTARAKGVPETKLLIKYPLRMAANPFISSIGWILPGLFAGETLVSLVLGIPTTGPVLLEGLINQDMHVAGAIIMIEAILTVIGTLISDILLAILDPRIRYY